MRSRRLPLVAAPFIFLLVLASVYLGRDRLSWFPSSQRQAVPLKQLTVQAVADGKKRSIPSKQMDVKYESREKKTLTG